MKKSMYKAIQNWIERPEMFAKFINKRITWFSNGCRYNKDGIAIFEEDWDNLIILDACRFDYFLACQDFQGDLKAVRSRGSTSSEFIRGNFQESQTDTVYITANPWIINLYDELEIELHKIINLCADEYRDAGNGFTTHPNTVTSHAEQAADEYSNKRLIVHYLQPHQPYLGEFGSQIPARGSIHDTRDQTDQPFEAFIRAYIENLELVLESVKNLFPLLDGKTVITSDHAELFGERVSPIPIPFWGHPEGNHIDQSLMVPWLELPFDERREIIEQKEQVRHKFDSVDEQLEALGYR